MANEADKQDPGIFPLGKLPGDFLQHLLEKYRGGTDNRLKIGPALGEDVAVIDMGEKYLVAKTDPITFATREIGWYAVNVNANDIVTSGARPRWFQACILLPENRTDTSLIEQIFSQIHEACRKLDVAIVGGHTEVTHGLNRPVVIGSMFGEVSKSRLITTAGARCKDRLILTKGIAIEGTALIAREKYRELLKKGYSRNWLDEAADYIYSPGISVVPEAQAVADCCIHAMHDPTEGGISAAIMEMALASGTGVRVYADKIRVLEHARVLCDHYGLDPMKTLTSGSLLMAAPPGSAEEVIAVLRNRNIQADIIGEFTPRADGCLIVTPEGQRKLEYCSRDDITRII